MNTPSFSFNFIQRVINPTTYEVIYLIVNDEGETFKSFSEDEHEKGFQIWLSYLTTEEKAQWDDYVSDCDAEQSVWQEQQKERLHFSFNWINRGLSPPIKENQMKSKIIQTLVECVLAIVIFGGIGVLLAWRA